jgi:hypothetical protein
MYLDVQTDPRGAPPVLREVDDFRDLKVVVHGPHQGLVAALAGIGRMSEGGDAFLAIDAVRRLAGARAEDPEWQRSFDGMVEYARSKGWLDDEGTALQAHCETAP